ncbi:5-(carboxyamino)imidazole ribonucleotide mutase [Peptoniphilus sp. KCTC 25270]|uniref:5-(carboxyamino)imidazole ribonucleotide mutase n=1 Tax=Peptoniphilus sp. KCTC 25270 TaxID=2897414 RepID=UPI001E4B67C5|nr:5-(carboxyamino)imidazole ribonucleotide mutase [Peptoniphilus sp. KCTC 25270]MCD1147127.1 5-(carboxyamino)imidazole ribonucleotide mutase [Peptoniphilus sp. KCTC 25270]
MKVSIIMGSYSDHEVGLEVAKTLKEFGISFDMSVYSAHRTPVDVVEHIQKMEEEGAEIFIAMAGKAAHLAGVIAGKTTRPVIGIPMKSSFSGGMDSLLSTVQMPSGVPVATVAVNGGKNAALLAVQMLSIGNDELKGKLKNYKKVMVEDVYEMNEKLNEKMKEVL